MVFSLRSRRGSPGFCFVVAGLLLAGPMRDARAQDAAPATVGAKAPELVEISRAIEAYDPADPSRIIGTFAAGTALRVGAFSAASRSYAVEFTGPDGKVVRAVCMARDLEPFLKKTAPETPKVGAVAAPAGRSPDKVLLVVSADHFNKKGNGLSGLNAAIGRARTGNWPFKDFEVVVGKETPDLTSAADAAGASTILHARVQDRTVAVMGDLVNGVTVNPTYRTTLTVLVDMYVFHGEKWDKFIVGRTLRTYTMGAGTGAVGDDAEATKMVPELAKFLSLNRPKDSHRLGN